MNRAILVGLTISSGVFILACGSSGNGQAAFNPGFGGASSLYQAPAFNSNQPPSNPLAAVLNPTSPPYNPDQPALNPNQPPSTGPTSGSPQGLCGFCSDIPTCSDVSPATCLATCQQYASIVIPCSAELDAVIACAHQVGLVCSDSGKARFATNACDSLIEAFVACAVPDGGDLNLTGGGSGGSTAVP